MDKNYRYYYRKTYKYQFRQLQKTLRILYKSVFNQIGLKCSGKQAENVIEKSFDIVVYYIAMPVFIFQITFMITYWILYIR